MMFADSVWIAILVILAVAVIAKSILQPADATEVDDEGSTVIPMRPITRSGQQIWVAQAQFYNKGFDPQSFGPLEGFVVTVLVALVVLIVYRITR